MWDANQKKTFAKEIIATRFEHGRAVKYLSGSMREALVAEYCFSIARGQMCETVQVLAMDDLLAGVRAEIEAKFGKGFFE